MSSFTIRNGRIVDGSGAPARDADLRVEDGRIAEIIDRVGGVPAVDVAVSDDDYDAGGRLVTPGFVDIHTHLDAQLAWDPIGTPSCWHGVTSVVMGNCGVTFAPCRPDDREQLAAMMESVEDIPAPAILDGMAWDWESYGEYLASMGRLGKGPNVGGMVGHCALRTYAMGERGLSEDEAGPDDVAAMCEQLDEAMSAGALGVSTSRTSLHRVPDGRTVPGTRAGADELLAFADVLGRHGAGVFEGAFRLGEGDDDELTNTRRELALMGEISCRSGRPVSFGLTQSDRRPDLWERVLEMVHAERGRGADLRPQTTARGVGLLFGLEARSPFDRAPSWVELRAAVNGRKLQMIREAPFRQRLIREADAHGSGVDFDRLYVMTPNGDADYGCDPSSSLAAIAAERGVSPAAAYLELLLESEGRLVANLPILNQDLDAVATMLDDPVVSLGLADAGAHVGQIMDASQPTFLLTHWVRDRGRWTVEEAVRRLTTDTADLFGLGDRGRIVPGAVADLDVFALDELRLHQPEWVDDVPGGSGRWIQRAEGFARSYVGGEVFMDCGEHSGALPGRMLHPATTA